MCDLHYLPTCESTLVCFISVVIPTQACEAARPTLPQETAVQTTLSQDVIRPTLSQETIRPTLSQETVRPTPGFSPLPGGSQVPIVAAVVVTVVIILLVIVIGVLVLAVILVRARRKKQQSEVEKFQSAMLENDNIELTLVKFRQENDQLDNPHYADPHAYTKPAGQGENQPKSDSNSTRETSAHNGDVKNNPVVNGGDQPGYSEGPDTIQPLYSAVQKTSPQIPRKSSELYADLKAEEDANADLPVYAAVVKEAPPTVPSKSEELTEYLESQNQPSNLASEVSAGPLPADGEYALPAKPPRLVTLSNPIFEGMESNPVYRSIDHLRDPTNAPQEIISDDIYTLPDTTGSQTVEVDHGMLEVVYSEPIKPSLFTDATEGPNGSKLWEDLQPYAPIYTVPVAPLQGELMPLEVSASNVREIHELGTGLFGQVVLAETVGLSPKDLKLSESDDDKSKSTFVAVKKLKPNAPNTTKEAFEKEVKFMARLDNRNVIRMLGVCYRDTPFIMMEYMEKGDLNQYLKKFKVVTSTDSELQGEDQIATGILVHMTTQIASAMKYLASHNFVHRDLATRNCLVGPNYLVKIADFGMSRSLYESHYYIIHGHAVLPVRWMSTECFYGKFSQKSDVWAFGVTMWEVFTFVKEQPYTGMSDQDVVKDAIKGKSRKLLVKPAACPPEVYEIMLKCWVHDPSQRATFEELFRMLSAICSSS